MTVADRAPRVGLEPGPVPGPSGPDTGTDTATTDPAAVDVQGGDGAAGDGPATGTASAEVRPARRRRGAAVTAVVAATAASIALRMNAPLVLQATWHADDALFTEQASHLLNGRWLGPYSMWTIAKGPGYPIFLAVLYKAHLPLALTQHAVHLVAAGVTAVALARLARSRTLGVVVYCVLALDPSYLGRWASTVSRDVLYGPLSLLVVGLCLLLVAYLPVVARRGTGWTVAAAVAGGGALGGAAVGYYLTRDERPWLVPAVLAVGLAAVAAWRRDIGDRPTLVRCAGGALVALLVAGGTGAWAIGQVADRNEAAYGTRVIADLAEGEIVRAYAEWQRVDVGEPVPLVPVTRAQLDAVFEVSPSAAELEPWLSGQLVAKWVDQRCGDTIDSRTCEYSGSAFVWALREAATQTGHMRTGGDAQRYFATVADEIADACGRDLPCAGAGIASMPPPSRIDEGELLPSLHRTTTYLFSFDEAEPTETTWAWGDVPRTGGTADEFAAMVGPLRGVDGSVDSHLAAERRAADRQQVVAGLTDGYRWAARLGVVPALLGLVLALRRHGRADRWPVLAVAVVALVAVASRVVLLAVIDMTAFKASTWAMYILPGVEFLLVALVIGWWLLASAVTEAWRRRPAGAPATPTSGRPPT